MGLAISRPGTWTDSPRAWKEARLGVVGSLEADTWLFEVLVNSLNWGEGDIEDKAASEIERDLDGGAGEGRAPPATAEICFPLPTSPSVLLSFGGSTIAQDRIIAVGICAT